MDGLAASSATAGTDDTSGAVGVCDGFAATGKDAQGRDEPSTAEWALSITAFKVGTLVVGAAKPLVTTSGIVLRAVAAAAS